MVVAMRISSSFNAGGSWTTNGQLAGHQEVGDVDELAVLALEANPVRRFLQRAVARLNLLAHTCECLRPDTQRPRAICVARGPVRSARVVLAGAMLQRAQGKAEGVQSHPPADPAETRASTPILHHRRASS